LKKQRDPGRGQLHRRGARVWRDEDNPTGPLPEQAEEEEDEKEEQPPSDVTIEPDAASPANSGPGAGGATESADRAKHHEGLHGGPSRKP
jgi:hypothetical protein